MADDDILQWINSSLLQQNSGTYVNSQLQLPSVMGTKATFSSEAVAEAVTVPATEADAFPVVQAVDVASRQSEQCSPEQVMEHEIHELEDNHQT